jgi:3-deoxy-D-manno-octulosonic acid (KDO) 8-phosphate synthase
VIESRDHTLAMADRMLGFRDELGINLVFKASFDKANRTSISLVPRPRPRRRPRDSQPT